MLKRRLAVYAGLLTALGWAAPRLATPWIANTLHDRLAARGVHAAWTDLTVDWSGARWTGLSVWAPGRGFAVARSAGLRWRWAWPPTDAVRVRGVVAVIDLPAGGASAAPNPVERPPVGALPVPVHLDALALTVRHRYRPVGHASAEKVTARGRQITASGISASANLGPLAADLRATQVTLTGRALRGVGVAGQISAGGTPLTLAPQPAGVDLASGRAWAREVRWGPWRVEQPAVWRAGLGWSVAGRALGGEIEAHAIGLDFAELRFAHLDTSALPWGLPLQAHAVLDGALLVLDPLGVGYAEGALRVRHGEVTHRRIAPVALDDLDGDLTFVATRGPFAGGRAVVQVRRRGVVLRAQVTADALHRDARLQVAAELQPVACQRAFEAIPRGLLGAYADARLEGTFAPRLTLDLPLDLPVDLRLRVPGLQGACPITALRANQRPPAALTRGDPSDVDWLLHPFAHPVAYATRPLVVGPGQPGYVPLGRLSAPLRAVTYLSEDPSFWGVGAVNVHLIQRALKLDLQHGRSVYGGSTLPQQLVKNLFLTRSKTLARKVQELVVAARVADVVPKARILELYLNCIEFAPNVYGIGRAARHYFGVAASALTPKQAVFLATAKPSPRYAEALRRRGRTPDTPHYRRYMGRLAERLAQVGALEPGAIDLSPVVFPR